MKVILLVLTLCPLAAFGQESRAYYEAAAKAYRKAAAETACPTRKVAFERCAKEWADCWANCHTTGAACNCPDQPPPIPDCPGDKVGAPGTGGGMGSSAATAAPGSGVDQAAQSAGEAYRSAIDEGQNNSGAIVKATLAGMGQISDPQAALTYGAVGMGIAGIAAFGEQKRQREVEEEQRLSQFSSAYRSTSKAFGFIEGEVYYQSAQLVLRRRKNGRIDAVERTDRYSITSAITDVQNGGGVLSFIHRVSFHNHIVDADSCVSYLVEIPIAGTEARLFNGNYTNQYSMAHSGYMNFRYTYLSNEVIGNIVGNGGELSGIPSGLKDVYFSTTGSRMTIRAIASSGRQCTIDRHELLEAPSRSVQSYVLVFPESDTRSAELRTCFNSVN